MNEITLKELLSMDSPNIIDIRDNYSYRKEHLPNAKNIPYYQLLSNYNIYLNHYTTYYLYCDYGIQSKEISNRLNAFGYHTYYVKEGYLYFKNNYK